MVKEIRRISSGGNLATGNPPTPSGVAEPHSDSGGGGLNPTHQRVAHLSAGEALHTEGHNNKNASALKASTGRSGSISSLLETMELDGATDDDLSVKGSVADPIDSDAERILLSPEADIASLDGHKKEKREKTAIQNSRKAYRNAKSYLKKMSNIIKLNKRRVSKFEADQQPKKMEKIQEESKAPARRLRRSNATQQSPKSSKLVPPDSEKKATKRGCSGNGEKNEAKRAKPSMSRDSPGEYQIAIINRSDPDGKMTSERWMEVEAGVLLLLNWTGMPKK